MDVRDLVVRLETDGVTDDIARSDFHFADSWALARKHLPGLQQFPPTVPRKRNPPPAWVEYFKGLVFALPLAICCIAMLQFRFSLWGGNLSSDLAAAVGLGTVSSFVVTGGLIQAMSRRARFFAQVKEYASCAATCRRWCGAGLVCLLLSGAFGLAACAWYALLPSPVDLAALAMHILLGLFWLAAGVLYTIERGIWISAGVVAGIAFMLLLHFLVQVPVIAAQMAGIAVATAICFLVAWLVLRKLSRQSTPPRPAAPAGRTIYVIWPYFLYGACYYAFLFADRLLAWTAHTSAAALSLQFRGDYEAALDVALFSFVLQVGWIQYSLAQYQRVSQEALRRFTADQSTEFIRYMGRWYWMSLGKFLPFAAAVALTIHFLARLAGFLDTAPVERVEVWALAGYALVVIALRNVGLLFSLSRPVDVLPGAVSALLLSVGLGYLLSRTGAYHDAVIGFTAGAVVFAVVSTRAILRHFRTLDHSIYASAL